MSASFGMVSVVSLVSNVLVTCSFQDTLDLCNRYYRSNTCEDQEQGEEQAEGTNEEANLDPGRNVVAPAGREVVPCQCGTDDHEALEPHTDVDEDRHEEGPEEAPADFFAPEDLRR